VSCCCGSQEFGERQRGTLPKHVELILEINKLLLLHLVGFLYYFTYTIHLSARNKLLEM